MRRSERLFLTAILVTGAALRFWGLRFGLPHPETRPDETTIVITATGLLYAGLNPHFFQWPSLEFYVVSAIYRIAWEIAHLRGLYRLKFDMFREAAVHATPFLIVPRLLSAAAGVVTIWLVYRLMDRLFDRVTALVAAFFVAVVFLHVRDSHFGVTDVPMTTLVVASLLALAAAVENPTNPRRWAASGALAGFAASTKYNGGVVLATGLAASIVCAFHVNPSQRRQILHGADALIAAALLAFLLGTPYAILDPRHFFEGLQVDFNHLLEGHGIALGRGWWYHLTFSLRYGLGDPLLIAGLIGTVLLIAIDWRKALLILGFPIVYYVMVGRGYTVFVRYVTPIVPFLCMTAAIALVWSVRKIVNATAPLLAAFLALLIALPSMERAVAFDALIARTDTRVLAQEWVAAHLRTDEWVGQIPPVLIYPEFGIAKPPNVATFDVDRNAFVAANRSTVSPEWIIVPTSPLSAYTVAPEQLAAIANSRYVRDTTIAATHGPEPSDWFDQQDLFFVPLVDFTMRDRPGPEIQIFRRQAVR